MLNCRHSHWCGNNKSCVYSAETSQSVSGISQWHYPLCKDDVWALHFCGFSPRESLIRHKVSAMWDELPVTASIMIIAQCVHIPVKPYRGVQRAVRPTAEEGMISCVVKYAVPDQAQENKCLYLAGWAFTMMDTVPTQSALNQTQRETEKKKKRRKKIKRKGRKEIPDVNSKVCPAPVCGHWSFVYLPLLKPLPPAAALGKLHNKAREFSEALQSRSPTSGRRCCCCRCCLS